MYTLAGVVNCQTVLLVVNKAMQADTGNGTQITTIVSIGTSFGGRFGPREF